MMLPTCLQWKGIKSRLGAGPLSSSSDSLFTLLKISFQLRYIQLTGLAPTSTPSPNTDTI
jgi:hypothetical protein